MVDALRECLPDDAYESIAKGELELCAKFLVRDERNFHCWAYRRHVLSSLSAPSDEIAFSSQLIENNFSNYSAWHHRANLLTRELDSDDADAKLDIVAAELSTVSEAIFCEPADQAAWIFQRRSSTLRLQLR